MNEVLTEHKNCPVIVTHGQFIKEFLKQKQCWESIEGNWKGPERPPVKVVFKEGFWSAILL
tara:strand:+ start:688 stop:870 length:183 start_codon:yes stop_codon:yes gene_type:complete